MEIFNADCLEKMKELDEDSIDLIFCDLPYGQTSCKWDCKINLDEFWKQVMRIKKLHTPIFFTTTTKFGVDLITSAPKKCYFRYDLVWVKSSPAGFLSAKKMPMRKHEMIYVFYEKLPLYDLSSHKHKFIKEESKELDEKYKNKGGLYSKVSRNGLLKNESHYEPPLPVSVVKDLKDYEGDELCEYDVNKNTYGGGKQGRIKVPKDKKYHETKYNPPLPTTMLEIKSTRGKHSTEKPVALMEWIFKYYSKE